MQSPIPSPEAACPSCGQLIGNSRSKFCPHCGAALQPSSPAISGLKIFGAICLGLLVLPSAGMGACFLVLFGLDRSGGSKDMAPIAFALGMLLFAVLCVVGMVKLIKR